MQECRLNSIQASLRYHDLPGEDTPIVFIHGLGCAGSLDYPQVAAQPELSGHRRIVLDMLGAGYSDKPENFGYTVSGHAEYLAEWVDAIGLKGFVLFGHSLGGAVALALAEKRRDRISRLILGEANLDAGGGFASRAIASYSEQDFAGHGLADYTSRQRQEGNTNWAASLSLWSPLAAHRLSKSAIAGQTPAWREILYSLTCPRTYIFGERSLPDPDMQALADQGVHIEIVERAGHSMAWENPAGLAAAIKNGIMHNV